jgi:hypothetical protein
MICVVYDTGSVNICDLQDDVYRLLPQKVLRQDTILLTSVTCTEVSLGGLMLIMFATEPKVRGFKPCRGL